MLKYISKSNVLKNPLLKIQTLVNIYSKVMAYLYHQKIGRCQSMGKKTKKKDFLSIGDRLARDVSAEGMRMKQILYGSKEAKEQTRKALKKAGLI
jgi:hypothetical protein